MICIPFQFTCERGKRQAKKECKIEVSMLEWLAVTEIYLMKEDDFLEHSTTARLLSFPNVIVTSHQGFLTEEALAAISRTTLQNAMDFQNAAVNPVNQVK